MYNIKHSLSPYGRSASFDDKEQGSSHTHRYGRYHRIGSTARDSHYPHRSKSPDRGDRYCRDRSPSRNDRDHDSSKSSGRDDCRRNTLQDRRSYTSRSPIRKERHHYRSKSPIRRERHPYRSKSPIRRERYHYRSKSPIRRERYHYRSKSPIRRERHHYRSKSPIRREGHHDRSKSPIRIERYRSKSPRHHYRSMSPIRRERLHYHSKSPVRDERYLNPGRNSPQTGRPYISRSPVHIDLDDFLEKSSRGEFEISEKKTTNKMSKENTNSSSGYINDKAISTVSNGDESVDSIGKVINENVKSSNENKTGTEDKNIDESYVIATEDCNSSCSNEVSNEYFEKRNVQEDLSGVSDIRLSGDLLKQNGSETSVIDTENVAPEIIKEIYKQNDQILEKGVKTESMEFSYESFERSSLVDPMGITNQYFERKISTEATKTVENDENNPQVIVSRNEQIILTVSLIKDESKDNCGIGSERAIVNNNEETCPKNKSHFLGPEDCLPSSVDGRVQIEESQMHAIESYEKEQQVIDTNSLDHSTHSENIDILCSSKECFVRQDKNVVSMDIEVTQEIPVVNDELFNAALKTETMVAVSQKKQRVTEPKIYSQNQGDKNVIMKDIDILNEIPRVGDEFYDGIIKTESMSSTKKQSKEQDVDSNGIEQQDKFIRGETPYQLSFNVVDDVPSTFKKCCVNVDGNWYTEMKKKENCQRGFDEPICTIKNATRPLPQKAKTCLKKPVPKTTEIAKTNVMKPVSKNAKTSIMKPVRKIPKVANIVKPVFKIQEIADHRFTKLVNQTVETDDKKPEIEIEDKSYSNCEVTNAITKVLKVEPDVSEDETTDQIGDMKIRPCSDCPKRFSNAATIVSHREVHSSSVKMDCNFCPFTGNKKSLLMHTRAKHTQEKLFECNFCKKRFASCATKKSHENKYCNL